MGQHGIERNETSETDKDESTGIQNKGQGVGEVRTGPVDPELEGDQRAASTGTTSGGDSWRPSADPAAGDMATGSDQDNKTPPQGSGDNR